MPDLKNLSDQQIKNIIENHERQRRTDLPLYSQALDELQRRGTTKLDIDRSMAEILRSARQSKYLAYLQVAKANNLEWSFSVHHAMASHLDLVLAKSHAQGLPLITSIVVNQGNVETGQLDPGSLKGFISCAERLNYTVDDPGEFLREQQEKTFAYAKNLGDA